ncbi:hypothetical protein OKR38_18560 [Clostridioides difficile]|nr:hypothetical protein [Clostridioides difficile]
MRYYERTEDKKKRRGIYSEIDLLSYEQGFGYTNEPDWYYTGQFDRGSEKNIIIDKYTSINKIASRVYKTYYSDKRTENVKDLEMKQIVNITFILDPVINISLDTISKGCTIDYSIVDNELTQKFIVTEKLNGTVIATKANSIGGNYSIVLTDEQILPLQVNSQNNITIEISTEQGGLVTSKTATFTRTNNKPTVLVNSYNSTSTTFTAIDTDNNLSKIEWFIDDLLKETITTDLTTEKTINYELTDNAIHTLKIVATDAEGATAEKILSISKEIMPLQSDATLQDISSKLVEIGEGFRNGKTSIINTLAFKNIEASLNNTLVELSEKIKLFFDSSDASVQDLMNQLTRANNTISQLNTRYKVASGITYQLNNPSLSANFYNGGYTTTQDHWINVSNLGFVPHIFIAECDFTKDGYLTKSLVFASYNVFSKDYVISSYFRRQTNSTFYSHGNIYNLNEKDVYVNGRGVQLPAFNNYDFAYKWQAIKFV